MDGSFVKENKPFASIGNTTAERFDLRMHKINAITSESADLLKYMCKQVNHTFIFHFAFTHNVTLFVFFPHN